MANQAVYGIVGSRTQAEQLVQALVDANVNHGDISFLAAQIEEFQEFDKRSSRTEANRNWRTEERLENYSDRDTEEEMRTERATGKKAKGMTTPGGLAHEKHSKAPEGATAGAAAGGLIGGTLGLLAGIGALSIPGLGPFIAAGPLMAALSGLGAGGTIGGIIGSLVGSGIPEYEAKRYENRLKEGGILVAVRANSDALAKRIKEVMEHNGAEDVSISSEASMPKNYQK